MRPPRPPPRWTAAALLLASPTSALTLSSFQLITSSGTPIACLIVYSAPLAGCTTRDFTSGNACSASCVAGITDVQSRIADVCDGVDASAASVLGQAQRGNLVPLLCPSRGQQQQPSTRITTTAVLTLTTTSRSTGSSTCTSSLTASESTARSRPPVDDPPPASDLPPPPPPPVAQPTPTFVQSERPAQRPTATATTTSGGRPQATRDSDSGGGSPFDTVSRGGAGRGREVGGWGVLVVVGAVGFLLR